MTAEREREAAGIAAWAHGRHSAGEAVPVTWPRTVVDGARAELRDVTGETVGLGLEPTGEVDEGEVVARLRL